LKQQYGIRLRQDDDMSVFIVPMRNWNYQQPLWAARPISFLSYLWGIETRQFLHLNAFQHPVFIVPMRNWNTTFFDPEFDKFGVFIVPMRNWNS